MLLYSQIDKVQKTSTIKAGFLGLGYVYEQPMSPKSSINFAFLLSPSFGYGGFYEEYWSIGPVLEIEPRHYYNIVKRNSNGKKTLNNASNYLAISLDNKFEDDEGTSFYLEYFSVTPKWGFRRNLGKRIQLEGATGIGITVSSGLEVAYGLDFKLGYILNRK